MRRLSILDRRLLGRDERGAALTEFGFVAPVMMVLLMGAFDVGHTLYSKSILEGAVQKASRDSSLDKGTESAVRTAIDNKVKAQIREVLPSAATIDIKRRYFHTFAEAKANQAEPFVDTNRNGRCDAGEPYEDKNGNGVRDLDGGNGQGSAKDATVLTVTVQNPRLFPMHGLIGLPKTQKITAVTVLANQPYSEQNAPKQGNCT
jgi:Flp pilus assembly protein TadG